MKYQFAIYVKDDLYGAADTLRGALLYVWELMSKGHEDVRIESI